MQRFSLLGIVKHVMAINKRYFLRAAKQRSLFKGRISLLEDILPGFGQFPSPVQELLRPELKEGQEMAENGEPCSSSLHVDIDCDSDSFNFQDAVCDCRFYGKYRMPCRHIFQLHFVLDEQILTRDRLRWWSNMWEESGFEVYETGGWHRVPHLPSTDPDGFRSEQRAEAREVTESLLTSFYQLERAARATLGAVEGSRLVAWWITKLRNAATSMPRDFDAWKAAGYQ